MLRGKEKKTLTFLFLQTLRGQVTSQQILHILAHPEDLGFLDGAAK